MTIKLSEDEQAGFDILKEAMDPELALDIVKHRRRKKAHITARIARSLLSKYKAYGNVEKAAELHLERAWVGFEVEWCQPKGRTFTDMNNPMPSRPTANYGRAETVPSEPESARIDPDKRRQLAELARQAVRGMGGRVMQ